MAQEAIGSPPFPSRLIEMLFGDRSQPWALGIQELGQELDGYRYEFRGEQEFKRIMDDSITEAMRVYWSEILLRAHLASSTSILRGLGWLKVIDSGLNSRNFLCVAAGLRGLLESAADVFTPLANASKTLATEHTRIAQALRGGMSSLFLAQELEDCLLHYSHATKPVKGKETPYVAKTAAEYLSDLKGEQQEEMRRLYSLLCSWCHPSAASVWAWLLPESESAFRLQVESNERVITHIAHEFKGLLPSIPMLALNPAIVTLAVLGRVGLKDLHTRRLDTWNLDAIKLWTECKALLDRDLEFGGHTK